MANRVFKVLVSHPEVPKPILNKLRQRCEVILCEKMPPNRSNVLKQIRGIDAILWADCQPLNAEVLDAAGPSLKAVSTLTSGIDHIDVAEFQKRQIPLGHTPRAVNNAVADIALGLMISAGRLFQQGRQVIKNSQWETNRLEWLTGQEVCGSVIGFFGFGGIAQVVAKRLRAFDVERMIYHTRKRVPNESGFPANYVSFEELLTSSDFLVVAAPLTPQTKGVFNTDAFSKMKPNCVFVNVARGEIVDQTALYNALTNGHIFAAGLDVTTPEPLPHDDPLLALSNCVILPHIGTSTTKTLIDMGNIAAQNILNALDGKPMVAPAY